jgi:hypothetical protein
MTKKYSFIYVEKNIIGGTEGCYELVPSVTLPSGLRICETFCLKSKIHISRTLYGAKNKETKYISLEERTGYMIYAAVFYYNQAYQLTATGKSVFILLDVPLKDKA